jgi:hypothetical protein
MRTYGESEDAASSESIPQYPLYKRLGGPQSQSGRYGEERNLLPLPEIDAFFPCNVWSHVNSVGWRRVVWTSNISRLISRQGQSVSLHSVKTSSRAHPASYPRVQGVTRQREKLTALLEYHIKHRDNLKFTLPASREINYHFERHVTTYPDV